MAKPAGRYQIPGPSAQSLAAEMLRQDKGFDPRHVRPSGVGMCLKAQVLTILHALHPEEKRFAPHRPDGKAGLLPSAVLGDMHEEKRFEAWCRAYSGAVYGGENQYSLAHPQLKNPDGTPVTAHPDIYLPEIPLDEEVKSTGAGSESYLPKKAHLDQLLYRHYLWWLSEGIRPYGRIHYSFRENLVDAAMPAAYEFVPLEKGMLSLWNQELWPWDYLVSLEERIRYILACVDKKEVPPRHREADSPYYYECYFQPLQAECPWRESCWKEELAEAREPPVRLDNLAATIRDLHKLKAECASAREKAGHLDKERRKLQKELDPFFEEFGDRLAAGLGERMIVVSRKRVQVRPRNLDGYSFWRYDITTESLKKEGPR